MIESPLSELSLIEALEGKLYRLLQPDRGRLHSLIVLYVMFQKEPGETRPQRQIGLTQVLREPMGVGRVLNIGAAGLIDILNRMSLHYSAYSVSLTRTVGLDQLILPEIEPLSVLEQYYRERLRGGRR